MSDKIVFQKLFPTQLWTEIVLVSVILFIESRMLPLRILQERQPLFFLMLVFVVNLSPIASRMVHFLFGILGVK